MNETKQSRAKEGKHQEQVRSYVNLSNRTSWQERTFRTMVLDALPNQVRGNSRVALRGITNTYGIHPIETHASNVATREFFMSRPCGAGCNPHRYSRVTRFNAQNEFGIEVLNLIPLDLPTVKRIDNFESSLGHTHGRPLENHITNQIREGDPKSSFKRHNYVTCNKCLNGKSDCKDVKEACNDNALDGPKFLHSVHVAASLRSSEYIHG